MVHNVLILDNNSICYKMPQEANLQRMIRFIYALMLSLLSLLLLQHIFDEMNPIRETKIGEIAPKIPVQPMEPNDGLPKWSTIHSDEWNAHFTDFQSEISGERIINEIDTARDELNHCFLPFYHDKWALSRCKTAAIKEKLTCNIHGVGRFQVKCGGRVYIMVSLDKEDKGTEYIMKANEPPDVRDEQENSREEFQIMDFLSRYERSRNYADALHPRYPYVSWTMPDDKEVNVMISKRLIGSPLKLWSYDRNQAEPWYETEDQLMSFAVRCMKDIQNVREVLWRYKNAHFVHNDIHSGQVIVTKEAESNQYRCHVIDFGKMQSIDHSEGRGYFKISSLWNKEWTNTTEREEYIEQHGIERLRESAWRWKSMEWANMVFVNPLVQLLGQTEDNWNVSRICNNDFGCGGAAIQISKTLWCGKRGTVERLVDRMTQQQQKSNGVLKNEAFLDLLRAHLLNIEQHLNDANIDCHLYSD